MLTKKDKQELREIIHQELWEFFRFQSYCDNIVQQGKPPLSPMQKEVLDIIRKVPDGEGIIGSEIMLQYKQRTRLELPESSFRGIITILTTHYNICNKPRIGYYVAKTT